METLELILEHPGAVCCIIGVIGWVITEIVNAAKCKSGEEK